MTTGRKKLEGLVQGHAGRKEEANPGLESLRGQQLPVAPLWDLLEWFVVSFECFLLTVLDRPSEGRVLS